MVALTVLMYCITTAHIALALRITIIALFDEHAIEGGPSIFDDLGNPLGYMQIALELFNVCA